MPVDLIKGLTGFESLRSNWNEVYESDGEANLFLSWDWVHDNYLRHPDRQYFIAAWYETPHETSDDSVQRRYQAFVPLCMRVLLNKPARRFEPIVSLTGSYWADYTGVICNPENAGHALGDISAELASLPVYQLRFDNLKMNKKRQKILFEAFTRRDFKRRSSDPKDDNGQTNLTVAPSIQLPPSEDEWLANLSKSTRQKIRRYSRKVEQSDSLNIRLSTDDKLQSDLAAFVSLWSRQWRDVKGKSVAAKADYYARLINDGIGSGHMYMRVLTDNNVVVATSACYIDTVHKQSLFFVSSRDANFSALPAGLILHAANIKSAISNNLTVYDFLRGDEEYKYSLGGSDSPVDNVRFTPRKVPTEARLLPLELKNSALKLLSRNQGSGKSSSIEKIYSQLLESFPNDEPILKQYRDWLQEQGQSQAAEIISAYLCGARNVVN